MSHPTYTTGETITRTDVVRIGKGKVDYSVTLPSDPFAPASVEIENLATGRHKVIPAARLTLVSAAPAVCSHSWTEASATGRKCGACGEPVTPEVEASEAPAAPVADDIPADYDPEQTYADAAAYVAEVAPEVFAAGERAAEMAELTAARERAAADLAELFADGDTEAEDTGDDVERCPVCGEPSDYCQGHGETGDPRGWRIALAHDFGDHAQCDPRGCEAAGTTEHADYPHEVGYLDSCAACVTGGCVCCYSDSLAPCVSVNCEAREMDGETDEPEDTGDARPRFGGYLAGVVAGLLWVLAGLFVTVSSAPTAYASPVPVVTEDDPAWNCATMGDHECGPRAATPDVPAGCFPVPGRPGNTLWVMLTPSGSAGCESGR